MWASAGIPVILPGHPAMIHVPSGDWSELQYSPEHQGYTGFEHQGSPESIATPHMPPPMDSKAIDSALAALMEGIICKELKVTWEQVIDFCARQDPSLLKDDKFAAVLKKAGQKNFRHAQFFLGYFAESGDLANGYMNQVQALAWYTRAAKGQQGLKEAAACAQRLSDSLEHIKRARLQPQAGLSHKAEEFIPRTPQGSNGEESQSAAESIIELGIEATAGHLSSAPGTMDSSPPASAKAVETPTNTALESSAAVTAGQTPQKLRTVNKHSPPRVEQESELQKTDRKAGQPNEPQTTEASNSASDGKFGWLFGAAGPPVEGAEDNLSALNVVDTQLSLPLSSVSALTMLDARRGIVSYAKAEQIFYGVNQEESFRDGAPALEKFEPPSPSTSEESTVLAFSEKNADIKDASAADEDSLPEVPRQQDLDVDPKYGVDRLLVPQLSDDVKQYLEKQQQELQSKAQSTADDSSNNSAKLGTSDRATFRQHSVTAELTASSKKGESEDQAATSKRRRRGRGLFASEFPTTGNLPHDDGHEHAEVAEDTTGIKAVSPSKSKAKAELMRPSGLSDNASHKFQPKPRSEQGKIADALVREEARYQALPEATDSEDEVELEAEWVRRRSTSPKWQNSVAPGGQNWLDDDPEPKKAVRSYSMVSYGELRGPSPIKFPAEEDEKARLKAQRKAERKARKVTWNLTPEGGLTQDISAKVRPLKGPLFLTKRQKEAHELARAEAAKFQSDPVNPNLVDFLGTLGLEDPPAAASASDSTPKPAPVGEPSSQPVEKFAHGVAFVSESYIPPYEIAEELTPAPQAESDAKSTTSEEVQTSRVEQEGTTAPGVQSIPKLPVSEGPSTPATAEQAKQQSGSASESQPVTDETAPKKTKFGLGTVVQSLLSPAWLQDELDSGDSRPESDDEPSPQTAEAEKKPHAVDESSQDGPQGVHISASDQVPNVPAPLNPADAPSQAQVKAGDALAAEEVGPPAVPKTAKTASTSQPSTAAPASLESDGEAKATALDSLPQKRTRDDDGVVNEQADARKTSKNSRLQTASGGAPAVQVPAQLKEAPDSISQVNPDGADKAQHACVVQEPPTPPPTPEITEIPENASGTDLADLSFLGLGELGDSAAAPVEAAEPTTEAPESAAKPSDVEVVTADPHKPAPEQQSMHEVADETAGYETTRWTSPAVKATKAEEQKRSYSESNRMARAKSTSPQKPVRAIPKGPDSSENFSSRDPNLRTAYKQGFKAIWSPAGVKSAMSGFSDQSNPEEGSKNQVLSSEGVSTKHMGGSSITVTKPGVGSGDGPDQNSSQGTGVAGDSRPSAEGQNQFHSGTQVATVPAADQTIDARQSQQGLPSAPVNTPLDLKAPTGTAKVAPIPHTDSFISSLAGIPETQQILETPPPPTELAPSKTTSGPLFASAVTGLIELSQESDTTQDSTCAAASQQSKDSPIADDQPLALDFLGLDAGSSSSAASDPVAALPPAPGPAGTPGSPGEQNILAAEAGKGTKKDARSMSSVDADSKKDPTQTAIPASSRPAPEHGHRGGKMEVAVDKEELAPPGLGPPDNEAAPSRSDTPGASVNSQVDPAVVNQSLLPAAPVATLTAPPLRNRELRAQVEEALDSLSVASREVQNLEVARKSESAGQNREPVVGQGSEAGASDDLFSVLGIQANAATSSTTKEPVAHLSTPPPTPATDKPEAGIAGQVPRRRNMAIWDDLFLPKGT